MNPSARTALGVAKTVGGRTGRALTTAIQAALSSAPELGVRTGNLVNSNVPQLMAHLGRYQPGVVPIEIKKRMRKDAQISFALAAAKAPILAAKMYFESNSVEAIALLQAA